MARQAIYPFGRVGSLANVYRFPRSDAGPVIADTRLFEPSAEAGISGSISATEARDTAALAGALVYSGSLASTEAQDAATIAGTLVYTGTLATTEAQDAASFAGALAYSGLLTANEARDTADFSGELAGAAITGDIAATEEQDTASFSGSMGSGLVGSSPKGRTYGRSVRLDRLGNIIKDDFLDDEPEEEATPPVVNEPMLAPFSAAQAVKAAEEAAALAIQRAIEAKTANAKAARIAKLEREVAEARETLEIARQREAAWLARLREEDEMFLLAA